MSKNLNKNNILHLILVAVSIFTFFLISNSAAYAQPSQLVPESCATGDPCEFDDVFALVNNVLEWLVIIASTVAAVMFAYAGFLYLTAAGDTGQISKAHGIFKNVAIGFIIMLLAWLFIQSLLKTLGVDDALIKKLFKI